MSRRALGRNIIWDEELVLHSGTITADGAGQYDGGAKVLDLGAIHISAGTVDPGGAAIKAVMMVDVSACKVSAGDELYWILLESSSTSDFSSDVTTIFAIPLGDAAALPGGADVDVTVGQHIFPINGWSIDRDPTRYYRVNFDVAGTSPSITAIVRLGRHQ